MSDTPRTDEEFEYVVYGASSSQAPLQEMASFSRQLERELNAANERIKRLEEAGDRMFRMLEHDGFESVGQNMWKQAKESKP